MSTSSSRIPCQCLGVQYTNLLANGCLPNGSWGIAFIMSRNAFVGPITEAAKKIRPYKLLSRLCFFFVMVPLKTGNYSTIRIEKSSLYGFLCYWTVGHLNFAESFQQLALKLEIYSFALQETDMTFPAVGLPCPSPLAAHHRWHW
jgi:hypothetical protein